MTLVKISFLTTTMVFITHWASIQYYATYCAPPGFYGLLLAVVKSPSPVCIAANYLQFHSIQFYYTLWISIILSSCKLVFDYMTNLKKNIRDNDFPDKTNMANNYKSTNIYKAKM